jgi:hypothetical protein
MFKVKLSGGVAKYELLLLYMLKNRSLFKDVELTYYDMPDNCVWNGGRINRNIEFSDKMLNTFNKYKQGMCLGFTNNVILDVGDETGNKLLNMVANNNPNKMHGVVLMSETLRRYIRRNFPELKLTYSITGHPTTDQLNFEGYYKELEEKYDVIVPKYSHMDAILPLMQAGKLDGSKYEILINDNCNTKCQFYLEHFHQINHMNRTIKTPWESDWDKSFQVEIKPMIKPGIQKTSHCVQDDMDSNYLVPYVDVGVTHFKISGRDLSDQEFEQSLGKHFGTIQGLISKVTVE